MHPAPIGRTPLGAWCWSCVRPDVVSKGAFPRMAQRAMLKSTLSALTAWAGAVVFLVAASWPALSQSEFPLAGLRGLTTPVVGWPLAVTTVALAVFLSIPALQTRDRLLVCGGFTACLCLVVGIYVAPPAAPFFRCFQLRVVGFPHSVPRDSTKAGSWGRSFFTPPRSTSPRLRLAIGGADFSGPVAYRPPRRCFFSWSHTRRMYWSKR